MRRRVILGVVIAIGVALRLHLVSEQMLAPGFGWTWGGEIAGVAAAIARGDGFSSPYSLQSGPTAMVAPVYPYLLSLALRITADPRAAAYGAMFSNILWSILICVPLYAIGESRTAGLGFAAAAAWALAPVTGYSEVIYFWHSAFYAFVLTTLIWATLRLDATTPLRWWIAYGVFGGFSLLVDPAHSIAWPLAFSLLVLWKRLPWSRIALIGVVSSVTILPWVIRNCATFHRLTYVRNNLGWDIEEGLRTSAFDIGEANATSPARNPAILNEYVTLGEAAYMDRQDTQAWAFVRAHRAEIPRKVMRRASVFWTGNIAVAWLYWPVYRFVRLKYVCYALPGLLAIIGVVTLALDRGFRDIAILGATFLTVFPLPYYLTLTEPRYRVPIDPLLILLAVAGLWQLAHQRSHAFRPFRRHPVAPVTP